MSNMMKTCHPMSRLLGSLPTGYAGNQPTFVSIPDNKNGLFEAITIVDLWTDGNYVYYENNSGEYVFKNGEWEAVTWDEGYSIGRYTWTDGTNIYWSYSGTHKVLQGNSWKDKTWQGYTDFDGDEVWTDGTNIYCYSWPTNYILNGDTWEKASVSGQFADRIWTDGTHIYYSYYNKGTSTVTDEQFELVDGKWVEKTWNGFKPTSPSLIWTDGTRIYYSGNNTTYVLEGDTWVPTSPIGYGHDIWSDGTRVYYGTNKVLFPAKTDLYVKNSGGWSKLGEYTNGTA